MHYVPLEKVAGLAGKVLKNTEGNVSNTASILKIGIQNTVSV